MFFYYVRWYCEGNDTLEKGYYHTAYRTRVGWKEFMKGFYPTKHLEIRMFDTEEELKEFEEKVGLKNKEPIMYMI